MWSFAIKTLLADKGKLATALVGVVFSVVLVNIQGGLFLGLLKKASLLVDCTDADIWVGHKEIHNVDMTREIPRRWVHRIRSIPGVRVAEPYLLGHSVMTLPDGGFESVLVIGCEPNRLIGNAWRMSEGNASDVRKTDGIIVDVCEADKLAYPKVGDICEVGGRRARVTGLSHGILGFLVTPYVFTTLDRAYGFLQKPSDCCSYFLVQLDPGAQPDQVCTAIRERIPEVDAYPRGVYGQMSIDYWMTRTGLGISFGSSTALGLLVGLVIVGQTLYAAVLDRITEYATLKAIGANESHIYQILFVQASMLAGLGSILGLACVSIIQIAAHTPRAPILIPSWLSLGSCGLVFLICLISSLLPYIRVRKVDPVMVLQS